MRKNISIALIAALVAVLTYSLFTAAPVPPTGTACSACTPPAIPPRESYQSTPRGAPTHEPDQSTQVVVPLPDGVQEVALPPTLQESIARYFKTSGRATRVSVVTTDSDTDMLLKRYAQQLEAAQWQITVYDEMPPPAEQRLRLPEVRKRDIALYYTATAVVDWQKHSQSFVGAPESNTVYSLIAGHKTVMLVVALRDSPQA